MTGMDRLILAAAPSVGEAGLKSAIMILVVFAVLVVLALIIAAFGLVGKKADSPAVSAPKTAAPAPDPVSAPSPCDDEGEVVAAIMAAVSMMQPQGVVYQVKRVTPVKVDATRRSEWAAAALRQNTMPF